MIDATPANAARCREMAHATYDLAERAEDPEVIGAYLVIAAGWLRMADRAARAPAARPLEALAA